MAELRFTEEHEWIRIDGNEGTIGISDYAQEQLGDIVYVELPAVGASLFQGDEAAVVESVKAASEIYAPVAGEVTAVNDELNGDPGIVNQDSMGAGWFIKMKVENTSQLSELMTEQTYKDMVEGLK
ncbi:MAG TPA: glycine cleavage system protein GcvH [Sneathiellales bacterium]|nr:glycine cleavage system protein GcvH [Sneathiellales bacterium]